MGKTGDAEENKGERKGKEPKTKLLSHCNTAGKL